VEYRHKEYLKPPVPRHEKKRVTVVKNKAVTQGSGQTAWNGVEGRSDQRQNRQRKNDRQKGRDQGGPRPPPPVLPSPTPPPSTNIGESYCKSVHNLFFTPNILHGRRTPIEPTELLISKSDLDYSFLEESPLPPPPVPGAFPPPPNSPSIPLGRTIVKQFQLEDSDDGSDHPGDLKFSSMEVETNSRSNSPREVDSALGRSRSPIIRLVEDG
jgi:hypothetical protein